MQPCAGVVAQIIQRGDGMEHIEPALGLSLDTLEPAYALVKPDRLRVPVCKRPYRHGSICNTARVYVNACSARASSCSTCAPAPGGRDGKGFRLGLGGEPFSLTLEITDSFADLAELPDIVRRHMLPSMLSYIIVSLTLSVPGMILAETSLSFLGLGLRAPVTSWGRLLKEAQNVQTVGINPWLILPVFAVIVTVLAYNFLGDGLRDAADPHR